MIGTYKQMVLVVNGRLLSTMQFSARPSQSRSREDADICYNALVGCDAWLTEPASAACTSKLQPCSTIDYQITIFCVGNYHKVPCRLYNRNLQKLDLAIEGKQELS